MKHSVFINEKGFIEFRLVGSLQFEHSMELGKQLIALSTQLQDKGKDIRVLIDTTELSSDIANEAYRVTMMMFKDVPFKKLASFGASEQTIGIQRKGIAELGLEEKMKIFKTRKEAEEWLGEDASYEATRNLA